MFTRQRLIICVIIVLTGISSAFCDGTDVPQKITCSGKLVDDANKAVAGVKVKLHMLVPDAGGLEIGDVNTEEQITKDDGSFSFSVEKLADRTYRMGIVVVQKDGFAICWDNWDMRKDKVLALSLEKPYKLQGVVVDDANKPVADAEVRISMLIVGDISGRNNEGRYLTAVKHLDMLKTTTDANGIFVFKDIPAAGKAEFMVTKVGRATVSTFVFNPSNYNPGQYTVESKDIKIIQPVEAKIEGKVVESGTEKPVGGVKVTCVVEPRVGASGIKPVVSKEDGTFTFDGLEAKTYTVRGASSQKGTAQWVIEPANVTTTAGRTNSDVVIKASKGGVLEIIVRDNENKNIAGVNVHIRAKDIPQGQGGITDSNGVATIRLAPGEYELQGTYKEGYSSPKDRQTATVEDGKTTRLEIELKGSPKISGIVTDDKGKPLADATVRIFPMGRTQNVKSDTTGKFEVAWNPERWGGNQEIQYLLVARHIGRNLAVAVDIDEDTKTIDVKMSQGIVIKGKIVDANSKPLADAKVHVNLHISNWGTYVDQDGIKADAQGMYEYKALPDEQRYSVSAQADGYGQSYAEVLTEDAVDGLVEIEPMILKLAVMSVSGVVKDGNDKPVAGVDVGVSGQGQQNRRAVTDANGNFTIDKLCEGQVYIYANYNKGNSYLYGYANVESGDKEIELIIGQQGDGGRSVEKQPSSLKGKPLPDVNSIGVKFDANDVKDKAVLLCFVDMNQRPSRHCFKELMNKHSELEQKGIKIIVIQIGNADVDANQPFIKGQIPNDEKDLFGWGVKSLPWLVLTDKQHKIIADGFSVDEIDAKLTEQK
ncbi:MAG: carboxypeptidase-like regulatory domain-containing protein [Planctomycetaceae bacterium]|nr:carboxypeptidase-like regulatory domain-containing protein [Planctomycetaceae bacterium]